MANNNMNFAVDLLPSTTNTYNLGNTNKRWKIFANEIDGTIKANNITPILSREFTTGKYGQDGSGTHYYEMLGSITPTSFEQIWLLHYIITIEVPNDTTYTYRSNVEIYGVRNTYVGYKIFNSLYSKYPIYQHAILEGASSSYPHEFGYRLASSYGDTTLNKNIHIDIIETRNCTATFFDAPKAYTSTAPSNYTFRTFNATSNGLQETGDDNTITRLYAGNNTMKTSTTMRLAGSSLFGFDRDNRAQTISLYNNGYTSTTTSINTARVYNEAGFDWTKGLFYNTGGNYAINTDVYPGIDQSIHGIDFRYTDNCVNSSTLTTLGLERYKAVYFRGTLGTDGLFYLAPLTVTYNNTSYQRAWTQDIPTTADGYMYWFIGYPYYNGSYAGGYQLNFYLINKLYWFYDGKFQEYLAPATNITGTVAVGHGGTNITSYTKGDILYASNSSTLSKLGIGTAGYFLKATANGPAWANTTDITAIGTITTGTWNGTVIGAAYGGTGQNTLNKSANALINALDTGSSDLTANDYVITQYVNGGTTTTTYHRRPANKVINATLVKAALETNATHGNAFLRKDGTWQVPPYPVTSVAGKTGAVTLAKGDVGLGNVDNTADANKTVLALTDFKVSKYTISSSKGVRITYPILSPVLISCQQSLGGGRLILLGGGYGSGGTVRNTFTEIVSSSTYNITWSIPNSDSIGHSIEILNKQNSTVTVHVWSSDTCTFTEITTLTTEAMNASLLTTESTVPWSKISSKPTTISGYGITDAKIANGAITLGSNTISSQAAASGGTTVSLVTTGEKYTWNSKTSNTGTVTSITPGNGLINGTSGTSQTAITASGTISIKEGGVTNAMLAGSIANGKLSNSKVTIAGTDVSLGGSITADTLRTSLGLSNAMHFRGIATVAIDEGTNKKANPTITGYDFGTNGANALAGDVVIDKDSAYEYVWSADGTNGQWERLGGDSSYKTTQTAVNDPTAATTTSTTFIDTISQNTNGVITATKKTLPTASTSVAGITKVGASGGAAAYSHNHDGVYVPMTSGANDVNTLVNTGIYNMTSGSATNTPKGYGYGQLLTMAYRKHSGNTTTDWASQLYLHNGGGSETGSATAPGNVLYYRTSNSSSSNTWFSWQKAIHADASYTKIGSTTKGVYIDESGKVQEMSYTVSKNVPSDAVFTDTKNTAGSTNSTSQLFLIGATTQAANPTTNSYQYTYTNNGLLSSTKLGLNTSGTEKVHMEWNATDLSLDFIFD